MVLRMDSDLFAPILPIAQELYELRQGAERLLSIGQSGSLRNKTFVSFSYTYDKGKPGSYIHEELHPALDVAKYGDRVGQLMSIVTDELSYYRPVLIPLNPNFSTAYNPDWADYTVVQGGTIWTEGNPISKHDCLTVPSNASVTLGDSMGKEYDLSWIWYHGYLWCLETRVFCALESLEAGHLLQSKELWEHQESLKSKKEAFA